MTTSAGVNMPATDDYVGLYRIEDQIGAGGMASVYRAYHEKLDRHVAIKILHQSMQKDPAFRARFQREARIIARLEHPNLVTVYDFSEYEGQPYLVMKYINGRTLKDVMRTDNPTLDETISLMQPVADALTYAHSNGVLHRDIKPSNIIIDQRGVPYIADFGLARMMQSGESTMSADVMIGTPHYISPEQAQGNTDIDARTDVYSLGIVLYEMLTGRVPYTGDTPYAIVHDHIYASPPSPREINPDISKAVEQVLLKALAKRPEDRFATPTQLVDALKDAAYADVAPEIVTDADQNDAPIDDPMLNDLSADIAGIVGEFGGDANEIYAELQGTITGEKRDYKQRRSELKRLYEKTDMGEDEYTRRKFELKRKYREAVEARKAAEEAALTPEERLRRRVERRVKARRDEFFGVMGHLFWFLVINIWLFNLDGWIDYVVSGQGLFPGGSSWITLFWGMGMISHIFSYWNDHGPGAQRREAIIQREYERELERYYGKRKNEDIMGEPFYDDLPRRELRLTDDGELTDSMLEEGYDQKRKND